MVMLSVSLFENQPIRPPTPPKETTSAIVDETLAFLDDRNEIGKRLQTTLASSASLRDTTAEERSRQFADLTTAYGFNKKVGFSLRPPYQDVASENPMSSPVSSVKRTPTRRGARPVKSILKRPVFQLPLTPDELETKLSYFSPQNPGSFATMLQSVIRQLASTDLAARLDAYLAINGALKTYEGVPDPAAIAAKMDLLMQFMTRDMVWKTDGGNPDVNIVTQALKLAGVVLFHPQLSAALDHDFRTFIVDRSMAILDHTEMPKAIVKTYLFLLAQQRFHSTVMTASKAERIIGSLQTLEDRCSGSSAIATRLVIYQRLLEQAPAVMLSRARDWLEHVFHGMLSSIKDIRLRAIETCTHAGLILGTHQQASKALREMFEAEVEEGQSYFDYLCLRLIQMIGEEEVGPYVPQIWAATILFFRNKKRSIEKWSGLKIWLLIVQKCLNASDMAVKYQAALAWNKLVFVAMPDSSLSPNMLAMLKLPIVTGMEKRGTDRYSKQQRQYAADSYYNLLHYALRPGLSPEVVNTAWEVFVEPVLANMVKSSGSSRYLACKVLYGLCSPSTGVWNANAANEAGPIKPQDLPRLEPRWVRLHFSKFLQLVEPVLVSSLWAPEEATAVVDDTLRSILQTVAEAGNQEVKSSSELKEALALLVTMFKRLWEGCMARPRGVEAEVFTERMSSLLTIAVDCLGPGVLTDDVLTASQENSIQVVPTPSHGPAKKHSTPRSALFFIFGFLYQPPPALDHIKSFPQDVLAKKALQLLVSTKNTSSAKVQLLDRYLDGWASSYAGDAVSQHVARLWACVSDVTIHALNEDGTDPEGRETHPPGHELRHGMQILQQGVRYWSSHQAAFNSAVALYEALRTVSHSRAGPGGAVLAVVEPFARLLIAEDSVSLDTKLVFATRILPTIIWPRGRHDLEQARKTLWGVTLAVPKENSFDPFDHLYQLISSVLAQTYETLNVSKPLQWEGVDLSFDSWLNLLERCPVSLLWVALRRTQDGAAVWIQDSSRTTFEPPNVVAKLSAVWKRVLRLLGTLPSKDGHSLHAFEHLLTAGLTSPHKAIVNDTILFWNESYGREQSLEYPQVLERILRARLAETEISLPTFPNEIEESDMELPAFFETQMYDAHRRVQQPLHPMQTIGRPFANSPRKSSPAFPDATKSVFRPSRESTPKRRPRHNDSQIQFALIESSSPVRDADDSQAFTERQKEVRARQLADAQMFPDLSCSPVMQSAPPRGVQKRLDFFEDRPAQDVAGNCTPTALPDAAALMSYEIPSSPTPSSTRDVEQVQIVCGDDEEERGPAQDPPSSPPRLTEDNLLNTAERDGRESRLIGVDESTVYCTTGSHHAEEEPETELPQDADLPSEVEPADRQEVSNHTTHTAEPYILSDLPSDTDLPTIQLQIEEEAAALSFRNAMDTQQQVGEHASNDTAPVPSDVVDNTSAAIQNASIGDQDRQIADNADETTRVENSFFTSQSTKDDISGQQELASSQKSKKRKRGQSTHYTAKKQKQQSPFKRIFSGWLGRSQEDDDDMEEEIVVASSQVSSPPERREPQQAQMSPSNLNDQPIESVKGTSPLVEEIVSPDTLSKRRPGRPRKSETPTPLLSVPTRTLKRRASALSKPGLNTEEPDTSFVKDTPAPPIKARKENDGRRSTSLRFSKAIEPEAPSAPVSRRFVTAVVIPQAKTPTKDAHARAYAEGSDSPESQLAHEQDMAMSQRPIASPRSILARLRDALTDCKKVVLGSREERQFDDVISELRKEVGEAAGRRS